MDKCECSLEAVRSAERAALAQLAAERLGMAQLVEQFSSDSDVAAQAMLDGS